MKQKAIAGLSPSFLSPESKAEYFLIGSQKIVLIISIGT